MPGITLHHAQFHDHFHACAFVMGPDEEQAVIDPFLAEGMRQRQKAVYIVDPCHQGEHRARLGAVAPSPQLLDVTTWNEAHLRGGTFDQERMMADLEALISTPPGIEQLVAYEASVNEVLNRGKTPTVCVYDARRLTGSMMIDLLRAHPLTVMNGVLHENPFYTPAPEMLEELRRRRKVTH